MRWISSSYGNFSPNPGTTEFASFSMLSRSCPTRGKLPRGRPCAPTDPHTRWPLWMTSGSRRRKYEVRTLGSLAEPREPEVRTFWFPVFLASSRVFLITPFPRMPSSISPRSILP